MCLARRGRHPGFRDVHRPQRPIESSLTRKQHRTLTVPLVPSTIFRERPHGALDMMCPAEVYQPPPILTPGC